MNSERYQQGLEQMAALCGPDQVQRLQALEAVAPHLSRYAVEFFGDLYKDSALDVKTQEIATIAALVTLGNASRQLKLHINVALNVGCTREEITSVITQMCAYAGFPAASNGMSVAREVFAERDA